MIVFFHSFLVHKSPGLVSKFDCDLTQPNLTSLSPVPLQELADSSIYWCTVNVILPVAMELMTRAHSKRKSHSTSPFKEKLRHDLFCHNLYSLSPTQTHTHFLSQTHTHTHARTTSKSI